jgi:hypothetical protein
VIRDCCFEPYPDLEIFMDLLPRSIPYLTTWKSPTFFTFLD